MSLALNYCTDLHTPNLKADKKVLEKEFMNNLKLADDGHDFDHKLLKSGYKGIKKQPFSSGLYHAAQTSPYHPLVTEINLY
jgi:Sec7-like guanine-nucleotide exchange factor